MRLHEADTKAGLWAAVDQIVTVQPVVEYDRAKNIVTIAGGVPSVIGSLVTFANGREVLVVEKPDFIFTVLIWRTAWEKGPEEYEEVGTGG